MGDFLTKPVTEKNA